ncbi:MAG: DUF4249 family protein [Ignavibacteriales bacterium]|nr:DUF4249 family protein [Ignavibacteriales bacterium]
MKHLFFLVGWVAIVATGIGCKEVFSPKGEYEKRMVVYCVLSNQSARQYARVYSTYDPSSNNPLSIVTDNPVVDASVLLEAGGNAWPMKDTTVMRDDTSRYSSGIKAFVLNPFEPVGKTTYRITVNSPTMGQAYAETIMPGKGEINVSAIYMMNTPLKYLDGSLLVSELISPTTQGVLVRMFVEIILTTAGNAVVRMEVPSSILSSANTAGETTRQIPIYPKLSRTTYGDLSISQDYYQATQFSVEAFIYVLNLFDTQYAAKGFEYNRAIFYLYQTDKNLYRGYSITNGFNDEHSIRTDEPDFSNVHGGLGIVGSFRVDSAAYSLPPVITH